MSVYKFSAIIHTYYRPALLKEAVDALFRQTYTNIEIIIIDDGATPETVEYLHEIESHDNRVRIVHFEQNQFSLQDPHKIVEVGFNASLRIATGDYIWYQADDDLIADDYAEKMVALFRGHPDCSTAAGLPVGIDGQGKLLDQEPRTTNLRPRYMPGHELALEVARGNRKIFSAPGNIFTIRREVLVQAGGYHRCLELSQLYGIVPFGVTGFDETALFYWRRHEGQLNKQLTANGWLGIDEHFALLREWEIERRWRDKFGEDRACLIVNAMENGICRSSATWFATNLSHLRLRASWRILKKIWRRLGFWQRLPAQLAIRFRERSVELIRRALPSPVRRVLKPVIKVLTR